MNGSSQLCEGALGWVDCGRGWVVCGVLVVCGRCLCSMWMMCDVFVVRE